VRAKYYISINAGVSYSEFWPSNEPKVNYVREGDEIFLRTRVDKFRIARSKNQVVYDSLYNMFFDSSYFATDILYKINVLGTDKFFFIDPITSGNINTQDSVYESTPDPNDEYRDILKQYEKKWRDDAYSIITGAKVFGNDDSLFYPKLDTNAFVNVDFDSLTPTATSVIYDNNSLADTQTARLTATSLAYVNQILTLVVTTRSLIVGADPKMQILDSLGNPCSNQETITAPGIYHFLLTDTGKYLELSTFGNTSGGLAYEFYYLVEANSGGSLHTLLASVINGASYMNLTTSIVSTILWNDALGSDPPPAVEMAIIAHPTYDYVIGAAAILNGLWFARCDTFTTKKEDYIETSLKDIMAILRKLRLYWFIDEDGNFRIEHQKYFREYTSQADLTSSTYAGDKPEVDQRIYNYEKEDAYSQIKYSESNQSNEDWIAYPVNFTGGMNSGNVKDTSFSVTSDLKYINENPDDASSLGLVMLRTIVSGAYNIVPIEASIITPTNAYPNAKLAWSWLVLNYYNYFAESETGTVNNGTAITYVHVKEYLKQGNVKFRMSTD